MTTSPAADSASTDLALAAAAAAAEALPAVTPLSAAGAQPGQEGVAASFAGAAIAELTGPVTGRLAILVGNELTDAIAQSPIAGLDLAAAVQPAIDAAAAVLGATAQAATTVEPSLAVSDVGAEFVQVPLIGTGIAAAVLIPDALLATPSPLAQPAGGPAATAVADPAVAPVVDAADGAVPGAVAGVAEPAAPATGAGTVTALPQRGIEMLHGVAMDVTVELGRTQITVRELLALSPGTVLELDRAAGSPADLLVNGRLIARGEVVVVDEDFGLRITEILDSNNPQ